MKIKSFSLVELLLYLSMVGIIVLTVSVLLSVVLTSRIKTQASMEVETQGREIIDRIAKTISQADTIIGPLPGSTSTTLDTSSTNPDTPFVGYIQSSNNIYAFDTTKTLTKLNNSKVRISNLTFAGSQNTGSDAPSMRVSFTINFNNPSDRNEYFYQREFQTTLTINK